MILPVMSWFLFYRNEVNILGKEIFYRLKADKEDIPKFDPNPHVLVLGEVGRGKNFIVSFMPTSISVDKG
jgi:hypothetical protein